MAIGDNQHMSRSDRETITDSIRKIVGGYNPRLFDMAEKTVRHCVPRSG
jgi:hypothetical protein